METERQRASHDLQDRLIDFAVRIIQLAESVPKSRPSAHIRSQIIRCGTSASANYAEAQSAESRQDFVHKMKIVCKELRETEVWLHIIARARLIMPGSRLEPLLKESNELISIFVTSIKTAKRNG